MPKSDLLDATSVLDAAAEIVSGGGFATMTLPSLAATVGVSAEELGDRFGSLEEILVLMLNREFTSLYLSMIDNIERDPRGGLLSRVCYYTLVAAYERPLARVLYTVDRDALNTIMRNANSFMYIPDLGIRAELVERMQVAGTVRRDIDAGAVSQMLAIFSAGLAITAPHRDLDRVVRGLADLLARVVDIEVEDTRAGKTAFYEWAMTLQAT